MNASLKIYWNNNSIPLEEKVSKSDIVVQIPFGVMISSPSGSSPVTSVNGKIGDVVLNAVDVGATTQSYVDAEITTLQTSLQTNIDTKASTSYVDSQDGLLQTAINTKADAIAVTQSLSTKADLVGGIIPANQLPSFVDDVLEYNNLSSFPLVGEVSKIYIAIDTNKTYRWSSTQYVEIGGGGVALGETAATAYRGDRGKIAYDHSLSQGNPHNTTTSEVTEGVNKYFTDLRVRNTVVSGLVKTNSSNVTNTDTIEIALGKLAAKSEQSGSVTTWVDITTLTGFTKNINVTTVGTKIEVAKFDGLIWIRGHITTSNSININAELFSWSDTNYLWDYVPINSTFSYDTWLRDTSIFELVEYKIRVRQNYSGTGSHRMRFFTAQAFGSAINYGVIQPTPIGKSLN